MKYLRYLLVPPLAALTLILYMLAAPGHHRSHKGPP